ncbi:TIGR02677 family protein [Clostridium manihotivorum]|uniref:TIGR02677 family protein n=1 Tax=Clostridium manihotivorum TaxID=2320868 RepID=A0A410DX23_9CLOT|nr:TIGR02677 family protein [Clostridium manihotivorum]QAA33570.1 TIGR02677 family protein [Clostridium manihotivorum]
MKITNKLTKQIDEMRYVTAENAWRYRSILRFFYLQYEKMKYWMYKDEVFEELKKHEEFREYTIDNCKQDLDVLIGWKNLLAIQDTSKVSTVEEFKNKQFRYQLSEYSVEIERLTIRLENIFVESASLEPSLLERIKEELKKLPQMVEEEEREVGSWWSSLNSDFKRLNQNYQDYIRDLYSLKAEELMKTREFLIFKDKFIDYLRDFIKSLQYNSNAIEYILKNLAEADIGKVLEKAFEYEKSIPRIDLEVSEVLIRENIYGRWESLKSWFLGSEGAESEVSKLLNITNEIIRKITRYAAQIAESRNSAANRKEEYKKLCEMFLKCEDINEAHKLSSVAFGIFNMKHIKGEVERNTESINSGIFEEEPCMLSVKPRIRAYREKASRSPINSNEKRKSEMLSRIIKQREEEKKVMDSYIMDDAIDFSKLPRIEPHVRLTLLRWLSKGINASDRRGKTEDGRVFKVESPKNKEDRCTLLSEDGAFEMPAYVIRFEREI